MRGAGAAVFATLHALGYSSFLLIAAAVGEDRWRLAPFVMAALAAIPALAAALALPESPFWLLRKSREQEALNNLRRYVIFVLAKMICTFTRFDNGKMLHILCLTRILNIHAIVIFGLNLQASGKIP